MITLICPSRGRPEKSRETITKWVRYANDRDNIETFGSLDEDDPKLKEYNEIFDHVLISKNRSCVDAINNAAGISKGNVLIVVSDDTDCFIGWDTALLGELEGKEDLLLKTDDGIQDYIVTMTVTDRKYFERDGYIYHPDFFHQFADTYLTCKADIRGRLIKSNLNFPHNHYSHVKETPDELHKRNDATWREGQNTFVRLMKEFTPEERARIKDKSMQGFMKHVGL